MATTINGSTGASQIQDDTVTNHIANSQITNALMADDAIDSAEIADGAMSTHMRCITLLD